MKHALRRSIGVMVILFVLGLTSMPTYAEPNTVIDSFPSNPSNSSSASFTFTSTEAGSTFKCQLDGGAIEPCMSPKDYSGLGDGGHTFTVTATDPLGIEDPSPASFSWVIDTVEPDTSISSNPSNPSNSSSPSFTFTSTETGSTFECQLDGGSFSTCISPQSYSGLANGSHTFQVKAVDQAGNLDSTPSSYTWTIDVTPPDTNITSTPSNPSNSSSPSFTFTSTETGSTFECQLDGGGFSTCISPQSYSGLANGSHTFQVKALDQAGNLDATPSSYTWTIDVTPPDTNITSTPSNPSNSSSPSFTFTSTETGSTFECKLDVGSFGVCTSPKSYSGLSEGSHVFEVRAIDASGNPDTSPVSFSWTIDAVAPYTTLNGDWMVNIRGPNNDKGAAHITFDGSKISGYGFLFSLGQAFFIEEDSVATIDYTNKKVDGFFNIVTSGTSPTTLGKITISKGTFNKKWTKMNLTTKFDKEGIIPPIRITFSGYRFDPADPDIIEVPEGFTIKGRIKGDNVKGYPLTVIVEPSSSGDRLGILSGGGYSNYNDLPFELTISESLFFITDKGEIYGEFNSNLFSTVMRGKVTSTQKGPKFHFDPLLTFYAKRATVTGFAEEDIPLPPTLVSPENNATTVSTNPTFSWTPSSDTSLTYGLQVSTSSTFSSTAVNQSGLTGSSYNATGLTSNRKYYWRMNTTKSGVVSDWSPISNFTTATGGN